MWPANPLPLELEGGLKINVGVDTGRTSDEGTCSTFATLARSAGMLSVANCSPRRWDVIPKPLNRQPLYG
jgi:hypothetical protein